MGKLVQPPYTNRGVGNTSEGALRSCVDWLQVTFKNVQRAQDIADILGLDFEDFIDVPDSGKYGFSSHYRLGHIAIYYSDNLPYYHLELTGQGCREYEQVTKYGWTVLFGLMMMLEINVTRLDLAIDDFYGYFTLKQLKEKLKRGHIKSRFHRARRIDEYRIKDGETTGETIYFGRPQSDIQVRFYNKKMERENNKKTVAVDTWIRTELQLRGERAVTAFGLLTQKEDDKIGEFVASVLKNYINPLVPKKDKNKNRWPVCKWWDSFLGEVDKLSLTKIAPDATIERSEKWLDLSVSTSLATVLQAHNYDLEYLAELILEGERKQKKKHENMINTYRKMNGAPDIDEQRMNKRILFENLYKNSSNP